MTRATRLAATGLIGAVFALLAQARIAEPLWAALGGTVKVTVPGDRLLELAGEHLALALAAVVPSALAAIGLGIVVTRPRAGAAARALVDSAGAAAQAVPPVVVVALALPWFGFGPGPTVLALVAYGFLPVLRGTVAGIESVPSDVREAGRALGLTPGQILRRIELPLAAPVLAEALRIAVVLVIATASVGALAGTATLGTPIIAGLQNQNDLEVLQGAAATAALAFLADAGLLAAFASCGLVIGAEEAR